MSRSRKTSKRISKPKTDPSSLKTRQYDALYKKPFKKVRKADEFKLKPKLPEFGTSTKPNIKNVKILAKKMVGSGKPQVSKAFGDIVKDIKFVPMNRK